MLIFWNYMLFFLKIADFPPSYSWVHFGAETMNKYVIYYTLSMMDPQKTH